MNCGGAAKPGPMEILQHGPTDPRTLENAAHQNVVIAIVPPKSHSQPYRIYRVGNIDAIVQLWLQQTRSKPEVQAGSCTRNCARMRVLLLAGRKRTADREKSCFPLVNR